MGEAVHRRRLPLLGLLVLVVACRVTAAPRFGRETELWQRMLAAEDGRTASPAALAALTDGLRSTNPELWRWALRGLGRLEDEAALPTILPGLTAPSPAVRAEAVNAAGQAVVGGDAGPVRTALLAHLSGEEDPLVRGVIAATLGRLRHEAPEEVRRTATLLTDIARTAGDTRLPADEAGAEPPPDTWLGVARGFFFLARQPAAGGALPGEAADALRALARYGADAADSGRSAAHVRRLAGAALAAAARITVTDVEALLADDQPMVRREGAAAIRLLEGRTAAGLAERSLGDPDARVRLEAIRALPRVSGPDRACALLVEAVADENPHVSLLAVDGLGSMCTERPAAATVLDSLIRTLPAADGPWHHAAHALVAMARTSGPRAAQALPRFAGHDNAFVRAWAARAAQPLEDAPLLRRLAGDPSPNVRTVAVEGLSSLVGHQADSVYIDQLAGDDSQLLQAAAAALEGGDRAALPVLLDALDRVSAARRETWRDSRRALLLRIREFGNEATAARIRPYLADYDAEIAGLAAAVLEDWMGSRPEPRPVPPPRLALPGLADLEVLDTATVTIEMADGGVITLRLLPFIAPTNAWRFARLARAGYYDGLTFHRVVPNFVIQGGSPAANEFAGDGPFTRDEVSMMGNSRGTVGLSTRGRDTGDAQFYINLIDNTRLDHDYTVFAEVVSGMEVVDRILEGAVMRRVSVGAH